MELTKRNSPSTIQRRDSGVQIKLDNHKDIIYTTELEIGTPPQKFTVQVDTGSSDLFVPAKEEDYCQEHFAICKTTGFYVAEDSSTARNLEIPLDAGFADGSNYNGTYYKDTVKIGDVAMKGVRFGVSTKTASLSHGVDEIAAEGLIGIGLEYMEDSLGNPEPDMYPNVLSELYLRKHIQARAFSLYLNKLGTPTGSILFGGVDSSLYNGPLISAPMIPRLGEERIEEYAIEWTSFIATSSSGTTDFVPSDTKDIPIYALLDSGNDETNIPAALIPALYSYLGATVDQDIGAVVPCNLSTASANLTFGFGGPSGPKISAPVSNFVRPFPASYLDGGAPQPKYADGTPACQLTITGHPEPRASFGDNFLSSAYLVYHADQKVIALAQANLDPLGPSNVTEIGPWPSRIPGLQTQVSVIPVPTAVIEALSTAAVANAAQASETAGSGNPHFSSDGILTATGPARASITPSASASAGNGTKVTTKPVSPASTSPAFAGAAVAGTRTEMTLVALGIGAAVFAMAM